MKHLVLPDVQAKPGIDFTYLEKIGRYAVEKKPDKIICLGDFADMPSLSSYDVGKKSFEGRRYTADVLAARQAMIKFLTPIWEYNARAKRNKEKQYKPELILTLGNHENRINRATNDSPYCCGMFGKKAHVLCPRSSTRSSNPQQLPSRWTTNDLHYCRFLL